MLESEHRSWEAVQSLRKGDESRIRAMGEQVEKLFVGVGEKLWNCSTSPFVTEVSTISVQRDETKTEAIVIQILKVQISIANTTWIIFGSPLRCGSIGGHGRKEVGATYSTTGIGR